MFSREARRHSPGLAARGRAVGLLAAAVGLFGLWAAALAGQAAAATPSCGAYGVGSVSPSGLTATCTWSGATAQSDEDSWTVPAGVTSVMFDVYGASGGGSAGGQGAHVTATIAVTPGETLTIFDGIAGGVGSGQTGGDPDGAYGGGQPGGSAQGYGGGGLSAVTTSSDLLSPSSVLLMAGGGGGMGGGGAAGGSAGVNADGSGGSGADFIDANNAHDAMGGGGGTDMAGGAGGTGSEPSIVQPPCTGLDSSQDPAMDDGTSLLTLPDGGLGGSEDCAGGGGGGGGYYGGGGGGAYEDAPNVFAGAGGGAGASFVDASDTSITNSSITTGNVGGGEVKATFAQNVVSVTSPGNQTSTIGTAVSLQMSATDSASGQTLTYSATGLPAGLSISSSGLISGTPTTSGSSTVTVTASDATGAYGSTSFTWAVSLPVSISTTQQQTSATVGSSIADQATVSNGDNPTGTVTFNLYNNPNASGTPLFTDPNEPLVGGVATSSGYTAIATGTDYWVATYNGDANNNSVTSGAASEPVTVTPASPSINTTQQPETTTVGSSIADTATVSGGFNPTGTVTFNLYNNANGTGTPLFSDTESLSGGSATSKGYTTTATGTDYWIATYNGDSNNNSVTGATAAEPVTVAYGFGGFTSPLPRSTLVKSGSTIPVKFVLTNSAGVPIAASTASALASAGEVEATLANQAGIILQTAVCAWSSSMFQCNIKTPSGLKTGTSNPYTITAKENVGGGFITVPPVGTAVNPETVYFK